MVLKGDGKCVNKESLINLVKQLRIKNNINPSNILIKTF